MYIKEICFGGFLFATGPSAKWLIEWFRIVHGCPVHRVEEYQIEDQDNTKHMELMLYGIMLHMCKRN